jgi:hypothetical protein
VVEGGRKATPRTPTTGDASFGSTIEYGSVVVAPVVDVEKSLGKADELPNGVCVCVCVFWASGSRGSLVITRY